MSLQYREAMKFPFRNRWLMNLYIGFIQENFQKTAQVKIEPNFSFLSKNINDYLFSNPREKEKASTFEQNVFRADGTSSFLNKAHSFVEEINYGLVSENISDSACNLDFSMVFSSKQNHVGLKGLTMYFEDTFPVSMTIKAYEKGREVFSKNYTNDKDVFETTDVFGENADTLSVIVHKMNKPFVRFRTHYVIFGVGVAFDNRDFLTSGGAYRETFDICSVYLPTKEFSLELDNSDEKYNIDKIGSLVNLATVGQNVSLGFSYVHDDGRIESIPNEKLELDSFDISSNALTIRAVDFLRNENEDVEITHDMFTERMTLYDLAMIVAKYIHNPTFSVDLDDSLKEVRVYPTYIKTSCKNALMMIAGAARCMMKLTGGGVRIRRTTYTQATLSFKANNEAPYSNMNQLFDKQSPVPLATFEHNYIQANGFTEFPLDSINPSLKVGYVSDVISDKNGGFTNPPYIEISTDEIISISQFDIRFNDCTPKEITVETYLNGVFVEKLQLTNLNDKDSLIKHDFDSFNKMKITFNAIRESYRRVRVAHIGYSKRIYDLTYEECMEKPTVSIEGSVRNIIVNYFNWGVDENGNETVLTNSFVIKCNALGTDIEYDNPFITSLENAKLVAEWLREYYSSQIFYEVPIVGDPSLETNDGIRIPDKYNDNILANIEMNEISFSRGGIGGKIRARREDIYVARAKAGLETYGLYQ